jgi:pyruvate/2-oxoacid:ferredoxin oxidoreductase beta subunit
MTTVLFLVQGLHDGMESAVPEAHLAVDTGYWPMYRYHPPTSSSTKLTKTSQHPGDGGKAGEGATTKHAGAEGSDLAGSIPGSGKLILDVKKAKKSLGEFLNKELRFSMLARKNPEQAARLQQQLEAFVQRRMARLNRMASESM